MSTTPRFTVRRDPPRWRTPVTVAAVAALAAATVWRAMILHRGWFTQNDFLLMEAGLPLDDSLAPAGFSPGAVLLAQIVAGWAPLSWPAASAVVLALSVIAAVLLWDVLTRLLPGRWVALPVFTGFVVAPLTLWSTQWWTSALQFWPGTIGVLAALTVLLRATARGGSAGWGAAAAAGAATLVAMVFDGRWVLAPVLLLGILCSSAARTETRGARDAVRSAARSGARAWLLIVIAWVIYVVAAVLLAPPQSVGPPAGATQVTPLLRHLAALFAGGPWGAAEIRATALTPDPWAVGLGVIALAIVVRHTLVTGGRAARMAWASATVAVAGLAILLLGVPDPAADGRQVVHRYAAAASVILAVAIAAAYAGSAAAPTRATAAGSRPARPWRGRIDRVGPVLVALALAGSAALSTPGLAASLQDPPSRGWVTQARAQLAAAPRTVLLDAAAPWAILDPTFGARATVSAVLNRAPERPVFDLPSHSLRLVGPGGGLIPVTLSGPVSVVGDADEVCPYPIRQAPTTLTLTTPVGAGRRVLRLGYYTAAPVLLVVDVGTQRATVQLLGGLNALDIPLTAGFGSFTAYLEDPSATVCLATVEVGEPRG